MPRSPRKAIGKKLRFEVFKRDKFTCQYCGRKAPDVVLQCDHVEPVVTGGQNTLLNLITSCESCNAGKGPRKLDDATALVKQRAELDALAARREQIEMMMSWHRGLSQETNYEQQAFCERWAELVAPFRLTEHGMDDAKKWLRTFSLKDLLGALDIAISQYVQRDGGGKPTSESVNLAWSKIPGITRLNKLPQAERDLYYVRGILRRRLPYMNERACMETLRSAVSVGIDTEWLKDEAREARTWSSFEYAISQEIERSMREARRGGE